MSHMDDPDIDTPYAPPAANPQAPVDAENMATLMGMGFDERRVAMALRETVIPVKVF